MRKSIQLNQLNESFYEESRPGSGFFPMLFRSDRYLKDESEDEDDDNDQIAYDLLQTYVEQDLYEEKKPKKGSLFRKQKKTKKDNIDQALINEGLFIIDEEASSFIDIPSARRSSTNVNEFPQIDHKKGNSKKKQNWIELKEIKKF